MSIKSGKVQQIPQLARPARSLGMTAKKVAPLRKTTRVKENGPLRGAARELSMYQCGYFRNFFAEFIA